VTKRALHHYLIVFNAATGVEPEVREFRRPAPALKAYRDAEDLYRDRSEVQVVLLAADSLATIKKTHSNYWRAGVDELRDALKQTA
jgi:hypothetical protein